MDDEGEEIDQDQGVRTGGADAEESAAEAADRAVAGWQAPPHEARLSRRRFIVFGSAAVAGLLGVVGLFRRLSDPGVDARGGVAPSAKNLFSSFPVRSIEPVPNKTWAEWTLKVDGLVDNPLTLNAAGWKALPRFNETTSFHCVEGWSVDALRWGGVTPATILQQAQARPEGTYLVFHGYTGEYVSSLPISLAEGPQTILADTLEGRPLLPEHGGPLRLVAPSQLGYKSVKWVTRIEVTDKPVEGYMGVAWHAKPR